MSLFHKIFFTATKISDLLVSYRLQCWKDLGFLAVVLVLFVDNAEDGFGARGGVELGQVEHKWSQPPDGVQAIDGVFVGAAIVEVLKEQPKQRLAPCSVVAAELRVVTLDHPVYDGRLVGWAAPGEGLT